MVDRKEDYKFDLGVNLKRVKFYLIEYIKGNRGNKLAQFKFPFS